MTYPMMNSIRKACAIRKPAVWHIDTLELL